MNSWMKINLIKPIERNDVKPNWMNISKGIWLKLIYIGCYMIISWLYKNPYAIELMKLKAKVIEIQLEVKWILNRIEFDLEVNQLEYELVNMN